MHYLSSVHFVSQTLHVAGIFVAHHQEVGHEVAQLVEALRYKPESSGFDSQRGH